MSNAAICIGGPLDATVIPEGKLFDNHPTRNEYTLHRIELGETAAPILVFVSNDLTSTAAMHMVFAAYAKKGKK